MKLDPREYEDILVKLVFKDREVRQKVIPYLDKSIFENESNQIIVSNLIDFHNEFKKFPNVKEFRLKLNNEELFETFIKRLRKKFDYDRKFILKEIEAFFKDKLLWKEIQTTVDGLNDNDNNKKNSSSERFSNVLNFCFNDSIGLDVLESEDEIYKSLHEKNKIIKTGIEDLDNIIDNGFHDKTLSLFLGSSGMGKTLVLCSLAVSCLLQNKNVLYVTLEISEHKTSHRILANLFDENISNLKNLSKEQFNEKFLKIKNKVNDKLIVREYPPRALNINMLQGLLKDLEMKKKFVPDILFVDYMGLMTSGLMNKNMKRYEMFTVISEELRGLAVEKEISVISALQTNREGIGKSEIDATDMADSVGPNQTADVLIAITQSEELKEAKKYCFQLLKNRQGENFKKCFVGVDYNKMRIYSINNDEDISEEKMKQAEDIAKDVFKRNKKEYKKEVIDI